MLIEDSVRLPAAARERLYCHATDEEEATEDPQAAADMRLWEWQRIILSHKREAMTPAQIADELRVGDLGVITAWLKASEALREALDD